MLTTSNISPLANPSSRWLSVLTSGVLLLCSIGNVAAADTVQLTDLPTISARVVGGLETSIEQAPATAALLHTSQVELDGDLFQAQFCGGTVIAARWVLTAAHCVVDSLGNVAEPASLMVLTGSTDLANPVNQPIAVQRIIAHELYENVEAGYDIALLQLQQDAIAEPAAIDTQVVGIDEPAFIAGWGAINSAEDGSTQQFPTQLLGTYVSMSTGSVCGERQPYYAANTDDSVLCAGTSDGGKDTCQGDSGGPLYRVVADTNTLVAVSGITSWGIGCGIADYPGIYTSVAAYADWIQLNAPSTSIYSARLPVNDGGDPISVDVSATTQSELDNNSSTGSGAPSPALLLLVMSLLFFRQRRNNPNR